MKHGLAGLIKRDYVELNDFIKRSLDIELLKRTPSSYLGSCRYKLPDIESDTDVYEQIFKILDEINVKYFF